MGEREDNAQLDKKMVIADLPSDLSTIKLDHITLRLLLQSGSIRIRRNGTLHWEDKGGYDATYTENQMQTKIHAINTSMTALEDNAEMDHGNRTTGTYLHDDAYQVGHATITLAGGALNNTSLVAASATKKASLLWFFLLWDTAPAAAYVLTFQDEDDADVQAHSVYPAEQGRKFWAYADAPTVNKALEVDVSGGAGAEVLELIYCYCTF